jgi:hypothetical protein
VPVAHVPEPTRSVRGPFAGALPHQFERRDPRGHFPLYAPLADEPQPEPQPPPPVSAASESEMRTALAAANEAHRVAEAKLSDANTAADRAQRHVADCKSALAAFTMLDDDVTAATVSALRSEAGRVDLPDDLRQRLAHREIARVDAVAAERAADVLLGERAEASNNAAAAAKAVDQAIARVLAFTGDAIALEALWHRAEAERRRQSLIAFDRYLTPKNVSLPPRVRSLLGQPTAQDVHRADVATWNDAGAALRADPQAEVSITLPPPRATAPLPAPVLSSWPPVVHEPIQRPEPPDDGDPYLVPAAEES